MAAMIASTPINAKKPRGRPRIVETGRRGAPMPLILERASLTFDPGPSWVEVRPSSGGSAGPPVRPARGFERTGRGRGLMGAGARLRRGADLAGGARTLPRARARASGG